MYSYENLKETYGNRVSQTVDSPILVMDYFELSDIFIAVAIVMFFGVIMYQWLAMFALLFVALGVLPIVKNRHPKGILLHWPYRKFGMSLPGLLNPGSNKKFSN